MRFHCKPNINSLRNAFMLCYHQCMKKNDLYELSYELKQKFKERLFFSILFCILLCFFVSFVLIFLVSPVRQKSVSMEPNLLSGSCVLINHLDKKNDRGEIVLVENKNKDSFSFVFRAADVVFSFFTGQQIFPLTKRQTPGEVPSLRRIVGLPGDSIYMKDFILYIKPRGEQYFLTEFEFVKNVYNISISVSDSEWDKSLGSVGYFDEIKLGEDEYFVLSDNRTSALDSRLWGAVKGSEISGKVLLQYFPFNSFKFL